MTNPTNPEVSEEMVNAAFKALPDEAHGILGAGEMERVLIAALARRFPPADNAVAVKPPKTMEYTLRAMADNYADGPHAWDHLDAEACRKAADELHGLRAILWPPCPMCEGRGYVPDDPEGAPIRGCENCGGSGHVATPSYAEGRAAGLRDGEAERDKLREAMYRIEPYLRFTIGPESPGYHPTMPSAVALFLAALHPTDNDHGVGR